MSDTLKILLFFYSGILLANTGLTFLFWKKNKEKHFKAICFVWLGSVLNFFLQGLFQEPGFLMLIAFGSYQFVSFTLLIFTENLLKIKLDKIPLFLSTISFNTLSLVLWHFTGSFKLAAVPMAIAVSTPMIFAAFLMWKNNKLKHIETYILSSVIFLNAIHFLDYPILRFHPQGAVIGYSFAFFLMLLFTMIFPAVVIREASSRYQSKLEAEVKQRTLELEALSSQNTTLLNLVCHDLSTPITVLSSSSEKLKADREFCKDDNQEKHLHRIENASIAIRNILDKVRSLQSVRMGKERINMEKINPAKIVEEAIESLQYISEKKRIRINFVNLLDDNDFVVADSSLLKHQVLINLISNAIKFSMVGTSIDVRLNKMKGRIVIDIVDQGIGIPSHIIPMLFDFNKSTSRPGTSKEKGTGFGLPLVKTTLDYMGADISVSSVEVTPTNSISGSTFSILFDMAS